MRHKKDNSFAMILVVVLILVLLPGLACDLFSAQPREPEDILEETPVVDEPEVIDETETEHVFRPEQVFRLDFDETVSSVAFAGDGELMATGIYRRADIWRPDDGSLVQSFEAKHRVDGLGFLPADDAVALGVSVRGTHVYDINTGEQILTIDDRGYDPSLAISPNGILLASGNRNGVTWLWQISDGELVFEMDPADYVEDYSEYLSALAFSPDGHLLAAGYWDGTVFIWNVDTGELERLIEPETVHCSAWGLTFSNDGELLAVSGGKEEDLGEVIKLWQVSDGSLVRVIEHETLGGTAVGPVAYSPDDTLMAFGAVDGIYIWALPDYELLHPIPIEDTGEIDWVTDLAFSPDSQYLLAGYWTNYAILWQVQE